MSDNNNEFGAFMSGLLLGGIAGAITALLLAPQSGEETRKVILDKSLELKDKALETVEEARHLQLLLMRAGFRDAPLIERRGLFSG